MKRSGKSSQNAAAPVATIEICGIRVGDSQFGIPIDRVVEILGHETVRQVPLAPPFIAGLVHYRGDVLTTLSLRHLLRLPAVESTQDVLVFDGLAGPCGMQVDGVREVLTVSPDSFEPNPATLDEWRKMLFSGAYKLPGGLLIMLNTDRFDPLSLGA